MRRADERIFHPANLLGEFAASSPSLHAQHRCKACNNFILIIEQRDAGLKLWNNHQVFPDIDVGWHSEAGKRFFIFEVHVQDLQPVVCVGHNERWQCGPGDYQSICRVGNQISFALPFPSPPNVETYFPSLSKRWIW